MAVPLKRGGGELRAGQLGKKTFFNFKERKRVLTLLKLEGERYSYFNQLKIIAYISAGYII